MTWLLANWKMLAAAAVFAVYTAFVWRAGGASVRANFEAYKLATQQQAELQRESNRGRTYQAEQKEAAQTIYRDRYITRIVKEIDRAAQDLATCPVPPAVGRLLNDAARCASEDRPASCGAGDGLP